MDYILERCPFCNGEAYVLDQLHIFSRASVCCTSCHARTAYYSTVKQAVDNWNMRADDNE